MKCQSAGQLDPEKNRPIKYRHRPQRTKQRDNKTIMALKIEKRCDRKQPTSGDAVQQYESIVQQLAAGEEIEFSQIINVLVAVGRTAVELTDDVAAKQHENP